MLEGLKMTPATSSHFKKFQVYFKFDYNSRGSWNKAMSSMNSL